VIFEIVSTCFVVDEASFVLCGFSRDIRVANDSFVVYAILVVCE
jgi:hypothetical protein